MPIQKAMQRCVVVTQFVPIHWFNHSHQKRREKALGRNGPLKSPKNNFQLRPLPPPFTFHLIFKNTNKNYHIK